MWNRCDRKSAEELCVESEHRRKYNDKIERFANGRE